MSSWRVSKRALESALNVLFTVPARYGVDASEYVKIEKYKSNAVRLSLSSDMNGCSFLAAEKDCPIKDPMYIDRRMLEPFVTAGKDLSPEHYVFGIHDGYITLRHGHREAKFTSNKKSRGYAKVPTLGGKPQSIAEEMAAVMACARHVSVDDPAAPHLSCVYVYPEDKKVRVLSANAHVFFLGTLKKEGHFKLKNVALPLPLIDAVKTENEVGLLYSDRVAVLKFSCGTLWHPVKIEARKKFPFKTIEGMIKKGLAGKTLLRIDADALYDSASRASSYMSSISSEDPALKIETKKGDSEVRLLCSAPGAEFCEQIKLGEVSKGNVEIEWPLSNVLPILDYSRKSGAVRISQDDIGRTCFSTGKIAMLIGRREKAKVTRKKSKKSKEVEE